MKITICGSIVFIDEMAQAKSELERLGHEVKFPPSEVLGEDGKPMPAKQAYEIRKATSDLTHWIWDRKEELMRHHFEKVAWADAILVLNHAKNNIEGYIGANTLLEMGLAFHLRKQIFLLNRIPDISYKEEIIGMKPRVINGDLGGDQRRPIPNQMNEQGLRTWIEVDTAALRKNYETFRGLIGRTGLLMAVAKSNAYGHGLTDFAKTMAGFGADWIAVDSITEALALRRKGVKTPILVLGYTLPDRFKEAKQKGISLTVSTFENLKTLKNIPLKFHLKIDSGMHRQGFFPEQMPEAIKIIKEMRNGRGLFEGIYTHFAAAKNPAFPEDTLQQIKRFGEAADFVQAEGFKPLRHACATAGALLFPQAHFDLIRIGIGLYGLWPSLQVKAATEHRFSLKPALSWKTLIGEVKDVKAGSRIGYDFTEAVAKDSRVAVCPVGYWHGYPRSLSGIGRVLVRGGAAKVLGRISMDMITLDVSHIPDAKAGDEATLIGKDGRESVSADDLARLAETINYEIVTRLNPLIQRVYV